MLSKIALNGAVLVIFLALGSCAHASLMTFELEWSGAPFGNGATATGTITFDPTLIYNPGYNYSPDGSFPISAFSITVSGAAMGDGTYDLSDYDGLLGGYFVLDTTNFQPLDFTQELIGQHGPDNPWGTLGGDSGDFNIFPVTGSIAPSGVDWFVIATNGGSGESLQLTSFAPVPEPSSLALASLGGIALRMGVYRRSRVSA